MVETMAVRTLRRRPSTTLRVVPLPVPGRKYGYTEHGFTPVRRSAEHGFTLVELVVALFIFGLIAAAGVALLAFSVRAQAAAGERLDDIAALGRMSAVIGADMAQVVPRATRDRKGAAEQAFNGKTIGRRDPFLSFVRGGWSNVEGAPRASLQRVDYRLVDDRLERVPYPALDGAEPLPASVLIDHVERLTVRYRYETEWVESWQVTREEALPSAIELVVRRAGGIEYRQLFVVGAGA